VLGIGIGNRFVCKYLKVRGVNIVMLDIDRQLQPDVVGSVLNIPFQDRSFQTLEKTYRVHEMSYHRFFVLRKEN